MLVGQRSWSVLAVGAGGRCWRSVLAVGAGGRRWRSALAVGAGRRSALAVGARSSALAVGARSSALAASAHSSALAVAVAIAIAIAMAGSLVAGCRVAVIGRRFTCGLKGIITTFGHGVESSLEVAVH
ncbi:hypothetical protein [Catenulispora subtropica]|uniref:hypothetical protein n=1 Tax=Catenulispora subtropica TaxID=450798 RepID=UPI0031D8F77D